MKKLIVLFLSIVLVLSMFSLSACSNEASIIGQWGYVDESEYNCVVFADFKEDGTVTLKRKDGTATEHTWELVTEGPAAGKHRISVFESEPDSGGFCELAKDGESFIGTGFMGNREVWTRIKAE